MHPAAPHYTLGVPTGAAICAACLWRCQRSAGGVRCKSPGKQGGAEGQMPAHAAFPSSWPPACLDVCRVTATPPPGRWYRVAQVQAVAAPQVFWQELAS